MTVATCLASLPSVQNPQSGPFSPQLPDCGVAPALLVRPVTARACIGFVELMLQYNLGGLMQHVRLASLLGNFLKLPWVVGLKYATAQVLAFPPPAV